MMDVKQGLPTISMACASSFAFLMAILAGTNCNFIEITALDGDVLVNTEGDELEISQTGLGVACPTDLFSTDGDSNWGLSRVFFYITLVTGLFTCLVAIALASNKVDPTKKKWRNLSIGSALTALCSIPVFVIFESNPCSEFQFQQTCAFSTGSHLQIVATLCWVVGVAITQCLEPKGDAAKAQDELPSNPTETMQTDEEQGSSPRSAVAPTAATKQSEEEEKKEEEQEFQSFDGTFNAFTEMNEAKKAQESKPNGFKPIGRITVTPETDEEGSKYPAYQEEPLQERTPFQPKMVNSENQKEQPLADFANFDNFDEPPPTKAPPSETKFSKEKLGAMMKIMPISPQKKMANRLNNLKTSLSNIQRPSFARKSQSYDAMMEDDMSSKGSIYNPVAVAMRGDNMSVRSSNPSEESSVVSKTMSQIAHEKSLLDDWNALHAAHQPPPQVIQRHIQLDDEKEGDDWHALHMAMTAGVRMGLIEGMSGTEDPYEVASYHSDPEPVIYSSDEDDDEEDNIELRPNIPRSIVPDDNSTISSHSTTSVVRKNTKNRRRSLRSKHRQRSSDLLSSASVSLLSLTIDEETVEDILEEASEDDLHNPYSLVRTVSAPEPRRTPAIEVSLSSHTGRPLAGGDGGSVKTARPTIRPNFGKKKKNPLDLGLATPTKDPLDLGMAASPYKDPLDLGMAHNPYSPSYDPLDRDPLEMQDDVNSDDMTAPRENVPVERPKSQNELAQIAAVVTPEKPPIPETKSSTPSSAMASASPMIARRLRAMARDDSSSSESDGGVYDQRQRARALRIQRMKQQQTLNASNSTDETDLNTSYASKYSTGSSLPSPAKSSPATPLPPIKQRTSFKEEKKEDDRSESSAKVVTPDSKSGQPFSIKKDTTFDEDDLNVDSAGVEIIMPNGPQGVSVVSPMIGGDDISIITPHHDIKDSDSDDDQMHVDYVKVGADKVRERILNKFSFSERSQASASNASSENSQKYGSHVMDRLDLQLIAARRPDGAEYGEEEMSL